MAVHLVHEALATDYVKQLLRVKARQLTHKFGFNRSDQEDLEQDLTTHVLKQFHHFDPSRACVNTFVARIVDSAVAMILRDRWRIKRAAGIHAISLERTHVDGNGRKRTTLAAAVHEADLRRRCGGRVQDDQGQADLSADFERILAGIAPLHRQIALRLMNATETAIAHDLGISRRQVRNAVAAIREHFKQAGFTGI